MQSVLDILTAARVPYKAYAVWRNPGVFVTAANQLVGSYANLKRGAATDGNYFGWQAHHIVESQDLERLGIDQQFPRREQQICVLIPERAHVGRINSVLRNQNPTAVKVTATDLVRAYKDAYVLIGDYCGGGEAKIRGELVAIVSAIFRIAGLR